MADESTSPVQDVDSRWWQRIRRAFGVPDPVSDGHARAIIIGALAVGDPEVRLSIGEAVLDAVLELAALNQLDERFVDDRQRELLFAATADVDVPRSSCQAVAQHAWSTLRDAQGPFAGELIDKVAEHVRARPFEDAHGHYFRSDPPADGRPADT